MRLTIGDCQIEILGDPHLGRPFRNHVPLHRLGERERMQREAFKESLASAVGADLHICMGDLFDRPSVSNAFVAQAAGDYRDVCGVAKAQFVCLPGNHDISRDTSVVSSFELWAEIVRNDVIVPQRSTRVWAGRGVKLAFIPWHPTMTAAEVIEADAELIRGADAVFGHWDVVAIHATDNLIPAARLVELGVKQAITGHDHNRRDMVIDGLPVFVTGSMQPYSHGEDPHGVLYVTHDAQTAGQLLEEDPEFFAGNCLRVVGDWDLPIPNCLQFQVARAEEIELDDVQVAFEAFDLGALWKQAFEGVDTDVSSQLQEKFREIGGEE